MPPTSLQVSPHQLEAISSHVRAGFPEEVCGLMGGVGGVVREVFPVPNVAAEPRTSFFMEGQRLYDVLALLEKRGWDLVAIYHSHPPGCRTDPSPSDLGQAYYPDTLHVIIVPDQEGEIASLRAFAIVAGRAVEVPIRILPDGVVA